MTTSWLSSRAVYKEVGLGDSFMPHRQALSRISNAKNKKLSPAEFYRQSKDPNAERLSVVYQRYEDALFRANALDFDDLLLEAVRLLQISESVRTAYNDRFSYLLIDEYQDTNRCQYDLVRLLTQKHKNICAVGDEDQSIYGWRGADINNILDFERDYPDTVTIRLEQNYRSTKNILGAAGAVVANNQQRKGKSLWTEAEEGDRIGIYSAPDAENEALYIADSIEQILSRDPNGQVAVLYRTNAQSRQLEEALRRYGRAYIVVGGLSFYHRAEVKDILAYLKLLVSPDDRVSLVRIINKPARGIGRTTLEQIEAHARQNNCSLWRSIESMLEEKQLGTRAAAAVSAFRKLIQELIDASERESLGALMKQIVDRSGYAEMLKSSGTPDSESRLENLDELVNAAVEAAARGEGPSEFLDHAALVSEADRVDSAAQVSLLTIHNAKGLEWPSVFIAGLEEGLFPHVRSINSPDAMEEERRLCYVGMTRARKRLGLTWARTRRKFGGGPSEPRSRSRFLKEVPPQYTDQAGRGESVPEVDLFAEQHQVRETVKKHTYTGKTYNSLENIAQFFQERGIKPPSKAVPADHPGPQVRAPVNHKSAPKHKRGMRAGMMVEHPRYGKGMVLRREGDGEGTKLTVNFPGYGLKKLVAKYASLKVTE